MYNFIANNNVNNPSHSWDIMQQDLAYMMNVCAKFNDGKVSCEQDKDCRDVWAECQNGVAGESEAPTLSPWRRKDHVEWWHTAWGVAAWEKIKCDQISATPTIDCKQMINNTCMTSERPLSFRWLPPSLVSSESSVVCFLRCIWEVMTRQIEGRGGKALEQWAIANLGLSCFFNKIFILGCLWDVLLFEIFLEIWASEH